MVYITKAPAEHMWLAQLDNWEIPATITKAHVQHLWLAQLGNWEIPKDERGWPAHRVTCATPVNSSSDESDIESSDREESLTKIVKKCQKQRETSSDEDGIPLMRLAKRMQEKYRADKLGNDDTSAEDQKSVNEVSCFNEHKRSPRLRPYCKPL